ncbi:MAG: helix-turn-helix transcriptional regulator [Hespellia sp.]|nr:helix-turn-helix transcriptional regulator [Hespellia sp.]
MAYRKIKVSQIIENEKSVDPTFRDAWNSSRMEYEILGELVLLRKENGITQQKLSEMSGFKQQAISRIEKKENSPSLKTLCRLLDVMNYQLKIVPK